MADRLQTNLGLIRTLLERAPDKAVRELEVALGGSMGGDALASVRSMVESEASERGARDQILAPIKPLFQPRTDGVQHLSFPGWAYSRLWRAIRAAAPEDLDAALAARPGEDGAPPEWDAVCVRAASELRLAAHPDFAGLSAALDEAVPDGARQLAGCLDLIPLARPALARLPDWLQRMTEDRAATCRLAYKDAVAVAEDGGPRLFELIFANLAAPWSVLRLITAVMGRPADNYVSGSELAVFGLRLFEEIDRRLEALRSFAPEEGVAAAEAIGADIRIISAIAAEFEQSLNLGKEGPWGARLNKQKAALAKAVEGWLKKTDEAVAAALPLAPVRVGGRVVRQGPKLDTAPDARLIGRARTLLTLTDQVRGAAAAGGFATLRAKVCEAVEHRLQNYVEELVHSMREGEGDEPAVARLYMNEVADLTGRLLDDSAAQIVRRRAAAA